MSKAGSVAKHLMELSLPVLHKSLSFGKSVILNGLRETVNDALVEGGALRRTQSHWSLIGPDELEHQKSSSKWDPNAYYDDISVNYKNSSEYPQTSKFQKPKQPAPKPPVQEINDICDLMRDQHMDKQLASKVVQMKEFTELVPEKRMPRPVFEGMKGSVTLKRGNFLNLNM